MRLKHPVKAQVDYVQDFIVEFIREMTIADPFGKIRKAEFNQQFTIFVVVFCYLFFVKKKKSVYNLNEHFEIHQHSCFYS